MTEEPSDHEQWAQQPLIDVTSLGLLCVPSVNWLENLSFQSATPCSLPAHSQCPLCTAACFCFCMIHHLQHYLLNHGRKKDSNFS